MSGVAAQAALVEVRLLDFPLDIYERAREHNEELRREFALLALGAAAEGRRAQGRRAQGRRAQGRRAQGRRAQGGGSEEGSDAHPLPRRLTALVEQLSAEYAGVAVGAEAARDAALARGETRVDLVYAVPISAAQAARTLGALLDEADKFCREGEHLLTMATPPEEARFRRWYLGEFVGQLETGRPPIPWSSYSA